VAAPPSPLLLEGVLPTPLAPETVVPEIVLGESGGEVSGRTVGIEGDEVAGEETCERGCGGERASWVGGVVEGVEEDEG